MFAYCLNNPVMCVDPSGALTRGQIHNMVLSRIIDDQVVIGRTSLRMTNTCIYYNCVDWTGKWGFCDLYDSMTGEVWELKRITCDAGKAKKQLDRYTAGALKSDLSLNLTAGGELIPFGEKRFFSYSDDSGTYDITYWDSGNGILWYDYTYQRSDKQKRIDAALAVGATTATCAVLAVAVIHSGGMAATTAPAVIQFMAEYFSNAA